jgi:hypothetical protein
MSNDDQQQWSDRAAESYGTDGEVSPRKSNQKWGSRKLDFINAANYRLPGATFKVACCILKYINQRTEKAWPSQETIALETKLSVRTVKRAVRELVRTGWYDRRIVRGRDGKTHNIYTIRWENVQTAFDSAAQERLAQKLRGSP